MKSTFRIKSPDDAKLASSTTTLTTQTLALVGLVLLAGTSSVMAQSSAQAPASPEIATPGSGLWGNVEVTPEAPPNVSPTPSVAPPPAPAVRPEPIETPIGTEAYALANEPPIGTPLVELPKSVTLVFATWNMAAERATAESGEAQQPETSSAETTNQKTWRHTFGSERTNTASRAEPKGGFEADVIALQGVRNLSDVRRIFGARAYHVIASRQLLARSTATSTGRAIFRSNAPPTTALVYRRRRGVRVAGYRHFLPSRAASQAEASAITAFRLRIFGKLIWFASLDVPPECEAETENKACASTASVIRKFVAWSKSISTKRSPLVLAGRWPSSVAEQLAANGLQNQPVFDIESTCTPSTSGILVTRPKAPAIQSIELATTDAHKENPCVGLSEMRLNLREE